MTAKFLYMKLLGLMSVTFGFGYCLTSFYNFFDVVLGNGLVDANANLYIMSLGLIFPLFIFIFGVFFYFYADVYHDKKSNAILISTIIVTMIGILKLLLFNDKVVKILWFVKDLMGFIHISFAYVVLIISILLIYGRLKYKY